MVAPGKPIRGTTLRAADGKLYFIPDDALPRFEVPQQDSQKLATAIAEKDMKPTPGFEFADSSLTAEHSIAGPVYDPATICLLCSQDLKG